jgi:outer membrane protein TolC
MEEVENGITGLTSLDRAAVQANASVDSAQRAFDIASERYKGGVAVYLDVLTAQQALLGNQRQAVQIHGQQFLTTVYLVKALGGGWQEISTAQQGQRSAMPEGVRRVSAEY